jgi:hypothetical protein
MRVLFALLLVFATISMAQARLGETADQLVARFGPALNTKTVSENPQDVFSGMTDMQFEKQGFEIDVVLADPSASGNATPIAVSEFYRPRSALTEAQIQVLLDADSEGHKWKEEPKYNGTRIWTRDDGAKAWKEPETGNMNFDSKYIIDKKAALLDAQHKANTPDPTGF